MEGSGLHVWYLSVNRFVIQRLKVRASSKLSTGFKEFQAYLAAGDQPQALFNEAVNLMKRATRKYATTQVKWIRKRLLPAIDAVKARAPTSMYSYVFDTSSMSFPFRILRELTRI
jgi:tRNA A37 N6-isopentenylltransferase MiaA